MLARDEKLVQRREADDAQMYYSRDSRAFALVFTASVVVAAVPTVVVLVVGNLLGWW